MVISRSLSFLTRLQNIYFRNWLFSLSLSIYVYLYVHANIYIYIYAFYDSICLTDPLVTFSEGLVRDINAWYKLLSMTLELIPPANYYLHESFIDQFGFTYFISLAMHSIQRLVLRYLGTWPSIGSKRSNSINFKLRKYGRGNRDSLYILVKYLYKRVSFATKNVVD